MLRTIETFAASHVHLEVTNLLIPGKNDSDADINGLIDFVASLSDDIPLHISAYHPDYKLNTEATPADTMLRTYELAREKLKYVFLGNMVLKEGSDSICAECGHLLVERNGYRTNVVGLDGTRCAGCDTETGIKR